MDFADVEMELSASGREDLAVWVHDESKRLRTRIERLRGMLKSCAGWFLDLDRGDLHERCMEVAGDMEAPLFKTPND